jgi:hypothetical protein
MQLTKSELAHPLLPHFPSDTTFTYNDMYLPRYVIQHVTMRLGLVICDGHESLELSVMRKVHRMDGRFPFCVTDHILTTRAARPTGVPAAYSHSQS